MELPLDSGQFRGMKPEQMRVFQLCQELQGEIDGIMKELPEKASKIVYHMTRSNESLGFALSEGLVAYKPLVKANFFDVSRRETEEVKKGLRRIVQRGFVTVSRTAKAMSLANALIGSLVVMIKQQEERAANE